MIHLLILIDMEIIQSVGPEGAAMLAEMIMAMLQQGDNSKLEQAVAQAKSGNYAGASEVLRSMLTSPKAQTLLKELEEK